MRIQEFHKYTLRWKRWCVTSQKPTVAAAVQATSIASSPSLEMDIAWTMLCFLLKVLQELNIYIKCGTSGNWNSFEAVEAYSMRKFEDGDCVCHNLYLCDLATCLSWDFVIPTCCKNLSFIAWSRISVVVCILCITFYVGILLTSICGTVVSWGPLYQWTSSDEAHRRQQAPIMLYSTIFKLSEKQTWCIS